jgi:hypothetical protein
VKENVVTPSETVKNVPDTELNLNRIYYIVSGFITTIGAFIISKAKKQKHK